MPMIDGPGLRLETLHTGATAYEILPMVGIVVAIALLHLAMAAVWLLSVSVVGFALVIQGGFAQPV